MDRRQMVVQRAREFLGERLDDVVHMVRQDRQELRPDRRAVVLLQERRPFLCRDIAKLRPRTSKGGNPQEIGPKI